jgi:hypothetical protein
VPDHIGFDDRYVKWFTVSKSSSTRLGDSKSINHLCYEENSESQIGI